MYVYNIMYIHGRPASEADADVLQEAAYELALSGGFRRIFPTATSGQYADLMQTRYHNVLLQVMIPPHYHPPSCEPLPGSQPYRGTSRIRNRSPLGPCSRTKPRALCWS